MSCVGGCAANKLSCFVSQRCYTYKHNDRIWVSVSHLLQSVAVARCKLKRKQEADPKSDKRPNHFPGQWTHQESLNLTQDYQEKLYSLKFKACQWQEVVFDDSAATTALFTRWTTSALLTTIPIAKAQGLASGAPWPCYNLQRSSLISFPKMDMKLEIITLTTTKTWLRKVEKNQFSKSRCINYKCCQRVFLDSYGDLPRVGREGKERNWKTQELR
ncbi:hypothetical protein V6N13_146983 [Hibiscus sabdariffa]